MLRKLRTPVGLSALVLLALVGLMAVFAPVIWGAAAEAVDTSQMLAPPSTRHWVGTDQLGRDLLARTLVATRLTVLLALAATAVAVAAGLALGLAPMLLGRSLGRLVTAGVNLAVAFPGLLLALFFAAIFGVGQVGAVLAIGFAGAPSVARLTQNLVAGVQRREFVAAARILGQSRWRIAVRHILPNIAEPIVVQATIGAGSVLLSFAGLSFLGLGVQPPSYDWGRLMNEGLNRIYINPFAALAPGLAVVVAGLAFNLAGESIAAAFRVDAGPVSAFSSGLGVARRARRERRAATRVADGVPDALGAPVPGADGVPGTPSEPTRLAAERPGRMRGQPGDQAPDQAPEVTPAAPGPVLDVSDLDVRFPGGLHPVRGVSLTLERGEAVGIVGESGAGKSLSALAIARLADPAAQVSGHTVFLGADLLGTSEHRKLLGTSLALAFQDPMSSFNPIRRMGWQLAEVSQVHQGLTRRAAFARAVDRLGAVRIDHPERRAHQRPHEFSGGMRQRAMLGMGLMASPALLIADEPTTSLDVTVQRQVLDLIDSIRAADQVALLLISHDVNVVTERCDRILVMYAGRVVEELAASALGRARHPYTKLLVAAVPDMQTDLAAPLAVIPGQPPRIADEPPGCAFAPRCPQVGPRCLVEEPPLGPAKVACWYPHGEPLPVAAQQALPDAAREAVPASAAGQTPPGAAGERSDAADQVRRDPADETGDAAREAVPAAGRGAAGDGVGGRHRPWGSGRGNGAGRVATLRFEDVTVRFGGRFGAVTAVDGVTLEVPGGQIVGLVGESGSGKSTLARAAVGLAPMQGGRVLLDGRPTHRHGPARRLQMVFQDPLASLDPRMRVGQSIAEALRSRGDQRKEVARLLELVHLEPQRGADYPAQLSGGQRQRVALARALAARPDVIIADEITSSLDVSIQGAILNLVRELQRELGLTILFISHNLAVVRYVASRIAVMQLGRIVEEGAAGAILAAPGHPYTQELLASVPDGHWKTQQRPGKLIHQTNDWSKNHESTSN
ncbi:MAG: dipeptide ABC transporter ATP-binding protein [Bifidobacteriaceae bacterium]|jgi:oligopeptide/dipeptide ABC transporter ATP-binding protein|nr:dipeptide ABC transporter ATP-binding protein [Bifidobacteriaceae bacterium]